jgi:suppressor of G2 allele of SKP1
MEELLISACKDYINDNIDSALTKLSEVIETNSSSLLQQALLYRATAYRKIGKFQNSLEDLEKLLSKSTEGSKIDSFEMFFKLGQTSFDLEKYLEANEYFRKALGLSSNEEQRQKLIIWMNKTEIELKEHVLGFSACNVSASANQTVNNNNNNNTVNISGNANVSNTNANNNSINNNNNLKFIHNWFQTASFITINIDASAPLNTTNFKALIEKKHISIQSVKPENEENAALKALFELNLSNGIVPEASSATINNRKVEFKLKKEVENFQWVTLEKQGAAAAASITSQGNIQGFKPSYPSSSKVKKDWDNIDKEISKELDKEDAKGNDAMMKLFKQIYENGNEETRRAMVKSFQTSGGTVLSTNWGEVKEKEYDGKDRPTAPDGQEWADKVNKDTD